MKRIKFNGREVIVAPRKQKAKPLEILVPCVGRRVVNCTNGPGCKGHIVKWILL